MASNFKLTVAKDGMLTYEYESCGGDLAFSFNLLCEVGEPYQPWFRDEIRRRNLNVVTRELDVPPWVADFATVGGES